MVPVVGWAVGLAGSFWSAPALGGGFGDASEIGLLAESESVDGSVPDEDVEPSVLVDQQSSVSVSLLEELEEVELELDELELGLDELELELEELEELDVSVSELSSSESRRERFETRFWCFLDRFQGSATSFSSSASPSSDQYQSFFNLRVASTFLEPKETVPRCPSASTYSTVLGWTHLRGFPSRPSGNDFSKASRAASIFFVLPGEKRSSWRIQRSRASREFR